MWWIISLILILPLIIGAVVTTFILTIMLNGYPGLPDGMINLYLICICSLIPVLSLLAGFLAQKIADRRSISLLFSGILTGLAVVTLFPVMLVTLTFVLLVSYGML